MTTAGANADIFKAIETLPGTQQTGVTTGLFVRGGDASETSILIDEMVVQNAFFTNLPGVSQSGRFSPFQFKGISFSSGGYSARFGQALSSVLELNSQDFPEKNKISLGTNMYGVFVSGDKVWAKNSLEFAGSYNNSSLFYKLANSNIDFYNPPGGTSLSLRYVSIPHFNELLKVSVRYGSYIAGLKTPDPFIASDTTNFDIKNYLFYSSISFQKEFKSKWSLYTSASYSYNHDEIKWSDSFLGKIPFNNSDYRSQIRSELKKYLLPNMTLMGGLEIQHYGYSQLFDTLTSRYTETLGAVYLESTWSPFPALTLRTGIRIEHSELLNRTAIEPRISLAYKTGEFTQIAAAGGLFYENPQNIYLLYGYRPAFQEAIHYIVNFQWVKEGRTLRIEGYFKDYKNLIREYDSTYDPNPYRFITQGTKVDNSGYGFAKGIEVFWHDKKTVYNLDYWLSYSYIDTKRLYQNYLQEATPEFVSNNNLNIVAKYFVDRWKTNFSATWSYASGKPYYDPSGKSFLGDKTPDYQNLAVAIGYLTHIKKWFTVIYAGVDNVMDHHNIYGYRYSSDGSIKYPVIPALYRSVILGINFSLSQFDKSDL